MKRSIIMLVLSLGLGLAANAQHPINVKGRVTDAYGPVPGANILIKGTKNGTTTDLDGYYSIICSSNAALVVSFIGNKTCEVNVNGRSHIDILMQPDIYPELESSQNSYWIKRQNIDFVTQ